MNANPALALALTVSLLAHAAIVVYLPVWPQPAGHQPTGVLQVAIAALPASSPRRTAMALADRAPQRSKAQGHAISAKKVSARATARPRAVAATARTPVPAATSQAAAPPSSSRRESVPLPPRPAVPVARPATQRVAMAGSDRARAAPPAAAVRASDPGRVAALANAERPPLKTTAGAGSKPEARPRYDRVPHPPYPRRSRLLGEEGTVVLTVVVNAAGAVIDAHIAESSGHALLDGSALSTVRERWRFHPALHDGQPIASRVRVPVRFDIDRS